MVFPHFGPKGTKGLFSSWTGPCVIFRHKSQQNRAMPMERERKASLPGLLGQDPVVPRPRVLLELSGVRRKLSGLRQRTPQTPKGSAVGSCSSPRGSAREEAK